MVKDYNKYMEQESGRSMVEMLGVLAIIGVLSVGGISGYTTAMNKHKANEILNAAAVRAMVVSTQLQNGATSPTLDEFTENKVGDATFTGVSTSGDKFTIGFSMDNDDVLAQIKNIAGTDGIVRAIASGGLTYNDDLSTGPRASDNNGNPDACGENNTYCTGSGLCLEGKNQTCTCSGEIPTCKKCDDTGAIIDDDGAICTTSDNQEGTCSEGTCVVTPVCSAVGEDCSSNDTCCSGYCEMTSETEGTCKTLSAGFKGGRFLFNDTASNWWTANNWCLAHGGELMKVPASCEEKTYYMECPEFFAYASILNWNFYDFNPFGIKSALAAGEAYDCDTGCSKSEIGQAFGNKCYRSDSFWLESKDDTTAYLIHMDCARVYPYSKAGRTYQSHVFVACVCPSGKEWDTTTHQCV